MTALVRVQSFDAADMTLGQCLADGLVSRAEIESALTEFLEKANPIEAAPGIYAILPQFAELPPRLRLALIEIALLARV